jgi:hypothetical protein
MWSIPQVNQNMELQLVFQGTQPCLNLAQLLLRRYTPQACRKLFHFWCFPSTLAAFKQDNNSSPIDSHFMQRARNA